MVHNITLAVAGVIQSALWSLAYAGEGRVSRSIRLPLLRRVRQDQAVWRAFKEGYRAQRDAIHDDLRSRGVVVLSDWMTVQ